MEAWDVGTGVAGWRWDAPEPRGIVLLQHGYAEHAGRYVTSHGQIIPRLIAEGFSVRAIDLRGHGHSPGPRGEVDLFVAVDDHLATRRAIADANLPLLLLGHSLGGLVTAASVTRRQSKVAGVVLTGPALHTTVSVPLRLVAWALGRFAPGVGVLSPQPPEWLSRRPETAAAVRADPLIYRGRMPARTAATTLKLQRDSWQRYPGWRLPTLILHGSDDSFTELRGSERFARTIASTDHRLIVLPKVRHEVFDDVNGDQSIDFTLQWLVSHIQ